MKVVLHRDHPRFCYSRFSLCQATLLCRIAIQSRWLRRLALPRSASLWRRAAEPGAADPAEQCHRSAVCRSVLPSLGATKPCLGLARLCCAVAALCLDKQCPGGDWPHRALPLL